MRSGSANTRRRQFVPLPLPVAHGHAGSGPSCGHLTLAGRNAMPSANAAWLARSRAAVWHPCTQMKHHETLPLVPIERGEGVWLYDFEGRRQLDAVSSWWVNLLGHGDPRIEAALRAQLDDARPRAARRLHPPAGGRALGAAGRRWRPPGLGHAFYGSDGSSAIEIALKMSFHYWRNAGRTDKRGFVQLQARYHGETLGALAVTDVPLFRDTYAPLLARSTVPCPDPRLRRQRSESPRPRRSTPISPGTHATTAALIVEPLVQGAAGMTMYDAAYLAQARAITARHGVHLIADEIMTGFGRTGHAVRMGAGARGRARFPVPVQGHHRRRAAAVRACSPRDEVFAAFYDDDIARGFLHSHSYTGNPLACRAALAVLDIFRDDAVIDAQPGAGRTLDAAARAARRAPGRARFPAHRHDRCIRSGVGAAGLCPLVLREGLERELLLRPIGRTVYFMPPYTLADDAMPLLVERTRDILDRA